MNTPENAGDMSPDDPVFDDDPTIHAQEADDDDDDDNNGIPVLPSGAGGPRRRNPNKGKPRKGRRGKRVVTTQYVDDDDDLTHAAPDIPLMEVGNDCERIDVERMGPIHEGFLGYIEPDATEESIVDLYGGGKYTLKAKRADGKIITRRTIKIAGDPIFQSAESQHKWERLTGGKRNGESFSVTEFMRMQDERDERRRKEEQDAEERRRKWELEVTQRAKDAEREAEERRKTREYEWERQRQREQEEMDRRRRQEEDERERRRMAETERMNKQNQEFYSTMLQIMNGANNQAMTQMQGLLNNIKKAEPADQFEKALTVLASAKALFGGGGGDDDGDADPWTMFVKSLPQLLNSAGGAVGRAVNEIKGAPPQGQLTGGGGGGGSGGLPPELEAKFTQVATKWLAEGKDPLTMFHKVTDQLLKMPAKPPQRGNIQPPQAGTINNPPQPQNQPPAQTQHVRHTAKFGKGR